ncbi:hypothetical protein FACS1894193_09980 [Bacilli bacterium]|nr:hypothetical protein FACS1894192_11940 [Bacilli bacterium]GHU43314.1 hypothetical protein FACS1894193_09980 [Bacilli bacterium]
MAVALGKTSLNFVTTIKVKTSISIAYYLLVLFVNRLPKVCEVVKQNQLAD